MSTIISFGEWVRRRRKSLDLTQETLADMVHCAVITIKKIEQDERRPSRPMAERLADCLSILNGDRTAFLQAALGERGVYRLPLPIVDAILPASSVSANLPVPTTLLIGRRKELTEASLLLRHQARLLTITGTGGVGKSRLALELAHKLCPFFSDGVFFISLASIQDPGLVISKIAETMKLKENSDQSLQELLQGYISQQAILLVLDNFEHLLPAATLVAELLSHAPGLRILTTSRTPLHLSNEHLMTLVPLSLPDYKPDDPSKKDLSGLTRSEAVRLFVSCARARSPEFKLSETTGRLVTEVCQKLDGLPLAIELAAAQLYRLPLVELHSSMENRLDVLTEGFRDFPPRHQALRGTFEWSYKHLEPIEQRLFPYLGVFSGCFTPEAVEAVSKISEAGQALAGLLDKNMIYFIEESRSNMLETIREYAMERLEDAGEVESARRAHLEYFTRMVETAAPHLWDQEQDTWSQRLIADLDNIRAALHWSLERQDSKADEIELGARMAGASWYFWYLFSRASEGRRWLEIALQQADRTSTVRAKLWLAIGSLIWQLGDLPAATEAMRKSVKLYRILENKPGLAEATHILAHLVFDQQHYLESEDIFHESLSLFDALGNQVLVSTLISDLGMVACFQGDLRAARKYYEECLALFDQLNIKPQKGQAMIRLGDIARQEGNYQEASDLYQQALTSQRELKIRQGTAWATQKLGYISLQQGDFHHAEALFKESLTLQSEISNQQGIAECLAGLASSLVKLGEGEQAARLFGAAKGILNRTGLPMAPVDLIEWQRDEAIARALCDPSRFEKTWAEGEALNLKQAVDLANGDLNFPPTP